MRRILTFGLAWLAAAVLASVVAWQGVSLIGAQVTDSRPATLSADEIDAELADVTTTVDDGPSTTAPPAGTGGTGGTADPGSGSGPTTPPTTSAPAADPVTRVIPMTGGTAAFEFSPAGVRSLYARPNTGYRVERNEPDGNGWRVEFRGDDGSSRVDAWWDGGPQTRVSDDGADDSGESGDDD